MPSPRTQKQVVEKYKGNLTYYRHGHYLRWLKLGLFFLSVAGSIAAVMTYPRWGRPALFSTGPISANHAAFAHDCRQCHEDADPDLARRIKPIEFLQAARRGELPSGRAAADWLIQKTALTHMDRACAKCHDPEQLHQPQAAALSMVGILSKITVVHSSSCSQCHREHVGVERMKLPDSRTCETCHNDAARLAASLEIMPIPDATPLTAPASVVLPDGLRHFLVPRSDDRRLAAFKSFADGHPAFGYEASAAKDPTALKFNHQRHGQADIPKINGHALNCIDCHKATGDGAFFGRISYSQHCARCHALQVDPKTPRLTLLHGDVAAVRDYAKNMGTRFDKDLAKRFTERGIITREDFETRAFYTGDPPQTTATPAMKRGQGVFLTACAKCHLLDPLQPAPGMEPPLPKIAPVAPPDRWLTRGPFTHARHLHMACTDCHGDPQHTLTPVHLSTLTSDVLMPRRSICAECHHPADLEKVTSFDTRNLPPEEVRKGLTAQQRKQGGVVNECQTCHRFHTLKEASEFAREVRAPKP